MLLLLLPPATWARTWNWRRQEALAVAGTARNAEGDDDDAWSAIIGDMRAASSS